MKKPGRQGRVLTNSIQIRALLRRSDHHDHLAAFHLGHVLDFAGALYVFRNPFQKLTPKVLVRHFTSAKPQRYLDLVPGFEEPHHIAHLHIIVVGIRVGTELDLFDFDDLLLLPGLALALLLLIFELSEVHDFANGRGGVRRDFYQIQPGINRHFNGTFWRDDADVFSFSADEANFWRSDVFVDPGAGVTHRGCVVWSASDGGRPFVMVVVRA